MNLKERIKRRLRESLIGPPSHAPESGSSPVVQPPAGPASTAPIATPIASPPETPVEGPVVAPMAVPIVYDSPQAPAESPGITEEESGQNSAQIRISAGTLLESSHSSADAPVRNSHHADVFETTSEALHIRITNTAFGKELEFSCEPGEFVLDAADRAGLDLPYSCRSGGCLVCTARKTEGESEMGDQYVLEDEHEAAGFTLLCCTTVSGPCHFISHQEAQVE